MQERRLIKMQLQAEVYTSTWSVSHDERYFTDPDMFKPDRWLDPECKDIKEASQPFSLGYRACIGRKYGKPEV
jgi:cytochrome P450